jgi:hypothetical protein
VLQIFVPQNQTAYVQIAILSRQFELARGVKQGDPLSALLFIAVMEACFGHLKCKWNTANKRRTGAYFGIVVDDPEAPLSNLRFADDVLLFAHSKQDLAKMIAHLQSEAGKYGLKLNLGKTKILTNTPGALRPTSLEIGGISVQVLQDGEGERYLGRKLCLDSYHSIEISNRIAAGWAAFHKNKVALCNKSCRLAHRLRAFEAIVSPTVMYGASSWTMWADTEQLLSTTRRRMLRTIVGIRRLLDEPWDEYIKCATRKSEDLAPQHGLVDWVRQQHKSKTKLVEKFAHIHHARWPKRVLHWKPSFRCQPHRRVGRPQLRWTDGLCRQE